MPTTTTKFAKECMKAIHDRSILCREFYPGDKMMLLYSSRLHIFPWKIGIQVDGTIHSEICISTWSAVILLNEKNGHEFMVNGQRVKHFSRSVAARGNNRATARPTFGWRLNSGVLYSFYMLSRLECVFIKFAFLK